MMLHELALLSVVVPAASTVGSPAFGRPCSIYSKPFCLWLALLPLELVPLAEVGPPGSTVGPPACGQAGFFQRIGPWPIL